jgi:hypothetical protein
MSAHPRRDHRLHAAAPQFVAVLVVVAAAVGDHLVGALARPAAFARDSADAIDEREQLRHIVAISACQLDAQWHPVKVHDQVMFGASAGAVKLVTSRSAIHLEEHGCGCRRPPRPTSQAVRWR